MTTIATSSTLKLYELADAYEDALAWLDDPENEALLEAAGGAIPPELSARLDAIEDALDAKIERVALMVRTLEARSEVAASEAKRLSNLSRSYGGRALSLKAYLMDSMRRTGRRRVEGAMARVSLVVNPPSIRPLDPARIPADFAHVDVSGRVTVLEWEAMIGTLRKAGLELVEGKIGLDGREALRSLKDIGEIPDEPGRYEIGPFMIERGQRVTIR